jgi:8-oxo-dGTP pyrophosphatase MutT (NUDIX family)
MDRQNRQVAVLAISTKRPGKILLVTSRHSKSWSLAKGRIDVSLGAVESARREAFEEAGILGRMPAASIGSYMHRKSSGGTFQVRVFKMYVQKELFDWPEKQERTRRWVSVATALTLISNPSLYRLIKARCTSG